MFDTRTDLDVLTAKVEKLQRTMAAANLVARVARLEKMIGKGKAKGKK